MVKSVVLWYAVLGCGFDPPPPTPSKLVDMRSASMWIEKVQQPYFPPRDKQVSHKGESKETIARWQ